MNKVYVFQFLDRPCVRTRKVVAEFIKSGFRVEYCGNDRKSDKATADVPFRYFGFATSRGSKFKAVLLPFYVIHLIAFSLFHNVRVVYAADLDAGLAGYFLKFFKKSKVTFIYDVLDTYADRYDYLPSFINSILRKLEIAVSGRADLCLHVERMRVATLQDSDNVRIVRNVPKIDNLPVLPSVDSYVNSKTNRNRSVRLLLSGGLYFHRGLKEIVEAVKLIKQSQGKIRFELISIGLPGAAELEYINQNSNVIQHLGSVSSAEALNFTLTADLVFALYRPDSTINKLACPNKLYDAVFNGVYIMMNRECLIVESIDMSNLKVCANYSVEAIAEQLLACDFFDRNSIETMYKTALHYRLECNWEKEFYKVFEFLN